MQNRSERCIFNSPIHKGSTVFKVLMETGAVLVSDTPIRSGLCSKNLNETSETSSMSSTTTYTTFLSYQGSEQSEIGSKSKHDPISLTNAWFHDKLEKKSMLDAVQSILFHNSNI